MATGKLKIAEKATGFVDEATEAPHVVTMGSLPIANRSKETQTAEDSRIIGEVATSKANSPLVGNIAQIEGSHPDISALHRSTIARQFHPLAATTKMRSRKTTPTLHLDTRKTSLCDVGHQGPKTTRNYTSHL